MSINNQHHSKAIEDFEKWLNSFLNFEKLPQKNMFWLDTMEYFAQKAGNIHTICPTIHIAGSKGKGSTSAFISSILENAGIKTGLYTSPHIITFLERITENQKLLPLSIYESSAEELKKLIGDQNSTDFLKNRPITWFELITLYSFLCFKNAGMGAAVFETGLGGRLDATNIIKPEICCIGPIELEHTEFLGDTVEKIAAEKGGIIKEDTTVVVAAQKESVKEVFRSIAKEKHSEIFFIDEICPKISTKYYTSSDKNLNLLMETIIESEYFKKPLKAVLKLPGEFQAQNAALAAIAVKMAFPQLTDEQIEEGLSKTTLPARFEIVNNPSSHKNIPFLILDGAHTPKSVSFTMDTIKQIDSNYSGNLSLLFACAADKDVKDIVPLFKNRFKKIFITKPGNVKQSDISKLTESLKSNNIDYELNEDYTAQIDKALSYCHSEKSPLLVTGSFYLVAEVKKYLNNFSE